MQKIGALSNARDAHHVSHLLNRQGIDHDIRHVAPVFEVWIKHAQHIELAQRVLHAESAPTDNSADNIEQHIPPGKLTLALMAICMLAYGLYHVGIDTYVWFMMSNTPLGLAEIQQGQVWRLLTPIFLHAPIYDFYTQTFNPIYFVHILFNLLWLFQLGSLIETNESSLRLLLLVICIGIMTNVTQYLASDAFFFGMSGVVYGLLGYLWILSHFAHHKTGYYINPRIMLLMVAWLLFCYTGIIGSIANAAHLSGLIVGMALGFWAKQIWPENAPKIERKMRL